ncbi:MAG: transglycosylase domain-containing protein [Patescibacteria group bacterium]|nr:MAG: transglycosylase domain-containing protein [Patescibacteria group bacterium]
MLQWLKRQCDRSWFALKVIVAYVLLLSVSLATLVTTDRLGAPLWLAGIFALVALPVPYGVWRAAKVVARQVVRLSVFLWEFRTFRLMTLSVAVLAAVAVMIWNILSSGDLVWIGLSSEAIGIAAFAGAIFLARPPERLAALLRTWRVSPGYKGRFNAIRIILWLLGILLIDLWLYAMVEGLLWANWLTLMPDAWFEDLWTPFYVLLAPFRYRFVLATLPPIVFTIFALLARPPYLRRAAPRMVLRVRKIPAGPRPEAEEKTAGIPLLTVVREPKFVEYTAPDGRTGYAGERFVFGRMLCTGFAFGTVLVCALLTSFAEDFLRKTSNDLSSVESYQPVVSSVVYDRNDELMCSFSLENRIWAPISEIPEHVQAAFVASEDKTFWEHNGLDPQGIIRAGLHNLSHQEAQQGASTITAQVIKQVVLKDSSPTIERKLKQFFLAVQLERKMTMKHGRRKAKEKILEVYLNHVYLGKNAYGVEAAAQTYFGKTVKHLTVAEAAMLAGLPKAPSRDSPDGHYDRAKVRQRYVLGRMLETDAITALQYREAVAAPDTLIKRAHAFNLATAPYDCEVTRKFVERTFGYDAVYKHGLVIKTTFDLKMQRKAQAAVRFGLLDLERRLGFAGPEGHDKDAGAVCENPSGWVVDGTIEANARVVDRGRSSISLCVRGHVFPLDAEDVALVAKWERAKPGRALVVGDLLTVRIETKKRDDGTTERVAHTARRTGGADHPEALQAGIVAIDPQSGEIRALVGGYDWNENQFDNATQARRQTGSSIKPYIYLTALENGKTIVSTELDAAVCLWTASGQWCPKNYSGPKTTRVYYGTVDLITALAKSLNSVSVRLALEVGLDKIIGTMRALGIRSPIVKVFPMAVGTPELTLWEHTAGYATILSNGRALATQKDGYPPGIFVKSVKTFVPNPDGTSDLRTIYTAPERPDVQAVPSADAYVMTRLMTGVVEFGTGTRAKKLRRPVAGKTGTTNSFRDAWFMGGTKQLMVGTWVGRRTPTPIAKEATGGVVALPIWIAVMESIFPVPEDGVSFETPPEDFPIPDDVTLLRGSSAAGGRSDLLPFQRGKVPEAYLAAPRADFGAGAYE